MRRELSVIIPAYNEEDLIGQTLAEVSPYLKSLNMEHEIIVVDDGSTDLTRSIVEAATAKDSNIRLIKQLKNSGKGMAVKKGILEARYVWCLFMDADGATSVREWPAFEAALASGTRAVHASRHLPGSVITHPQPLSRKILGAGYRAICRTLFNLTASDFNCGFKAYETALARKVYQNVQMSDWSFDVEVIARLKAAGVVPVEIPVRWSHCQKKTQLAPFQTAVKTIRSIRRLRQILKRDSICS